MRRLAVAVSVLSIVLVGACGGGDDDDERASTTSAAVEETTTTVVSEPESVAVDATVYFAGFEVTFAGASYDPTAMGVVVAARFTNASASPNRFNGSFELAVGASTYQPVSHGTTIPYLSPGDADDGEIAFRVEPGFAFDDAVLTIGRAGINQAMVPLGSTGELVTLEPRDLEITGETVAGELAIAVHGGVLRADVPERQQQLDAGRLALTIRFDVTNSGTGGGGYPFTGDNLALTVPDGTTIAPDAGPIELLAHRATLPDQEVRFLVDDPAEGTYTLILREGDVDGDVEFTIAAA